MERRKGTAWRTIIPVVLLLALLLTLKHVTAITVTGYVVLEINNQNPQTIGGIPVRIVLTATDGIDFNAIGNTTASIFVLDDKGKPVYFWIEYYNRTENKLVMWVKLSEIPANTKVLYTVYYGGENPYTAYNDPTAVFTVYNNFRNEGVNSAKLVLDGSSFQVTGNCITISQNGGNTIITTLTGLSVPAGITVAFNNTNTTTMITGLTTNEGTINNIKYQSAYSNTTGAVTENTIVYLNGTTPETLILESKTGTPENSVTVEWLPTTVRVYLDYTLFSDKQQNLLPTSYVYGMLYLEGNANEQTCLDWMAVYPVAETPVTVTVRPDLTPPSGTVTITNVNPTTTFSPPAPVNPPISGLVNPKENSDAGQKIILSILPTVIGIYFIRVNRRIGYGLLSGGAILMVESILLGAQDLIAPASMILALGITLSLLGK